MSLRTFTDGYITAALWAESANTTDSDDRSIGDVAELSDDARATMESECKEFYDSQTTHLEQAYDSRDDEHLGHDFWLSRNGHGTGFWDRGLGATGDTLHDAAKQAGQRDLYIGDDGRIYA